MMQSLARWKYGLAAEPYQVDSGPRLRRQHCAAALDVGEPPHGAVYHDRGLLFCWSDGRPIYPETITDHFNRLVDRAGLPLITPHDVRHTYATMSLRAGVNPKIVSTRLGHATVAFTLDTYTEDGPRSCTTRPPRPSAGCSSTTRRKHRTNRRSICRESCIAGV